jgi:cardiolipin synthase (CMP-forming)
MSSVAGQSGIMIALLMGHGPQGLFTGPGNVTRYTQCEMPPWANLANLLTALRIVLVPFIIDAIVEHNHLRALVLLACAAGTDGLDGLAARLTGSTTRLGAYLDPIADKCLLSGVFLALAVAGLVPVWFVAVIFGRDLYILAAVAFLLWLTPVRSFPPTVWGKVSTFVQVITATVWLAANATDSSLLETLSGAMIWPCAAFTVVSGVHYTWRGLGLVRAHRPARIDCPCARE